MNNEYEILIEGKESNLGYFRSFIVYANSEDLAREILAFYCANQGLSINYIVDEINLLRKNMEIHSHVGKVSGKSFFSMDV